MKRDHSVCIRFDTKVLCHRIESSACPIYLEVFFDAFVFTSKRQKGVIEEVWGKETLKTGYLWYDGPPYMILLPWPWAISLARSSPSSWYFSPADSNSEDVDDDDHDDLDGVDYHEITTMLYCLIHLYRQVARASLVSGFFSVTCKMQTNVSWMWVKQRKLHQTMIYNYIYLISSSFSSSEISLSLYINI